jgi:hypothetical protein
MAFGCWNFIRFLIVGLEMWKFLRLVMECSCMAPLTVAVIVTSGFLSITN